MAEKVPRIRHQRGEQGQVDRNKKGDP